MRFDTKNRTIYSILILVCVVGFWLFENFYTPGTYSTSKEALKEANFPENLLPSSTTDEIVHHSYFSLSYNEPFEQAEWVAYVLNKEHLTYDDRKRPYFIEDPWVKSKSADWKNYKGSGYDRGHLVPAGDRRFSEQAYNETFYTSNISPQDRDFNAGVWNRLEMMTRSWAKRYGKLYIITGGVLEDGLDEIGDEDVAVPRYFYKIVAKGSPDQLEAVGFILPNEEQTTPLSNFAVTIDAIEMRTGIDFFKELPVEQQAVMESRVRLKNWKF
ncbi:DNA/RNA non-specific endonuclease [Maribacter sp. MJ134]|uniref:DNA/RNA non-specific endonuclease n=1 Tax=Maribacter sp. MJ134 TaxID=2496865 RepID=UPI000F837512|nr:DNA/RNA non-specific endonuclease [Maribacter sp. MJ134]AZQ60290.1 DNA/RNA non-specific endonuclease [Maribacter sp. MJ134]